MAVKAVHTLAWALFAARIFVTPLVSWRGEHGAVAWLIGIVFAEVLVLALSGWTCHLTAVAAHYTNDRRANFDIYLPEWLARHNKEIFGPLYLMGCLFALAKWVRS